MGLEGLDWDLISRESKLRLERLFDVDDIKMALDNCDGEKSPDLDGFTFEVFKKYGMSLKMAF